MLRFISRFIGTWLVAGALVAAVVDGAKSIAASSVVITPLSETLALIASGEASGGPAAPAPGFIWSWLLGAPTAALLAALGFLFLAAGRKRRGPLLGPEIAT
jgi:hypothetical protein